MKYAQLSFLTFLLSFVFIACNNMDKTGYINISKVYGEIEISERYKSYLTNIELQYAERIKTKRSINQAIKDKVLAKKSPAQKDLADVFHIQNQLDSLEQYYSKAFQDSSLKYNNKVKDLVNDLVYQYGLENKYTYLFSPASSNSFMYADSTLDISDEVIEYINQRTTN